VTRLRSNVFTWQFRRVSKPFAWKLSRDSPQQPGPFQAKLVEDRRKARDD
jgi:hypothetical protein